MKSLSTLLKLILVSLSFVACNPESEFIQPESSEATAAVVSTLNLYAKTMSGSPVTDVTFFIEVHREKGLNLTIEGRPNAEGLFSTYFNMEEGWKSLTLKSFDPRFPGKVDLMLDEDLVTHTWVSQED
ncbi:MAG: hypothetical protein AAGA10_18165 [Bacteroidota bacterium]